MRIETIVAFQDEAIGDIVTGIRVSHSAAVEDPEVMHGLTIGLDMEGQNFNY